MPNMNMNVAPGVVRAAVTASGARHVCPVWIAHLLASPVRRWFEDPDRILGPIVRPGDLALDIGCALGFFTLPLARLVGPQGRVICVDVQQDMLTGLQRRLHKKGLDARVEARLCAETELPLDDLAGRVDVALVVHMVHEVPEPRALFEKLAGAMKPGGNVVFAEPRGHVTAEAFAASLELARQAGLDDAGPLPMGRSHNRLLRKR